MNVGRIVQIFVCTPAGSILSGNQQGYLNDFWLSRDATDLSLDLADLDDAALAFDGDRRAAYLVDVI